MGRRSEIGRRKIFRGSPSIVRSRRTAT
jgi:hypothetical protein